MADDFGFSTILITILSGSITVTVSAILVRLFQNKDKKDAIKAAELKDITERRALDLKETTERNTAEIKATAERTAEELRRATEKNALDVKEHTERIARDLEKDNKSRAEVIALELKTSTTQIAADLIRQNDMKNLELIKRMDEVSKVVENIGIRITEVAKHVDDVNDKQIGMAKSMESMLVNIHTKADLTNGNVASIRNEILALQEDMDDMSDKVSKGDKHIIENRKRKRRRLAKGKEIDATSASQHSTMLNT